MDFIYGSYRKLSKGDFGLLCTIVWRNWFIRNSLLFNTKPPEFQSTIEWCKKILVDFRRRNGSSPGLVSSVDSLEVSWSPPLLASFKVNCRASTDFVSKTSGIGIVIRNHIGCVLSSNSLFQDSGSDFMSANAIAILKAIQFVKNCGLVRFYVESDATNVVNLINLDSPVNCCWGNIVGDIHVIMSEQGLSSITFDKAAYMLDRQALRSKKDIIWKRHSI
ncbi:hypothetical protein LWI28_017684 [Acer negundo]|uniref:RNase H type-1 domain-containing protein n=1 Tax=Acer negundo TaxID=4023 RepID=A0AAD5IEX8_ACENE|nr:hypothetical protein LWI28_017684 [Acer negundo]